MARGRPLDNPPPNPPPPQPIKVLWAEPPRTAAGCCPKCGKMIGDESAIRAHSKTCDGKLG